MHFSQVGVVCPRHGLRHPSYWLGGIWALSRLRCMGESLDPWPCHCRVAGVWSDLLSPRSLFFRCFISRYLSCGSDMMVSARCVRVLMTLILCSIGWWLWNCRYWTVCVGFLYTLNLSDPSVLLVVSVSSMGSFPSVSSSLVHWLLVCVCWVFRCCGNGSMFAVLITARASSTRRPQHLGWSWYASNALPS